jgi:GNAT superfamily N-acetyltransferase
MALGEVAQLRLEVFRAWPYLYEGTLEEERQYLDVYRQSPQSLVVGAYDGAKLVGASTGTPMEDHAADFSAAFAESGLDLGEIFYCAESVLQPAYRGRGLGHAFFDAREAHARSLGRRKIAFCAVVRPGDHPDKPSDYRPLDGGAFFLAGCGPGRGVAQTAAVLASRPVGADHAHRCRRLPLGFLG